MGIEFVFSGCNWGVYVDRDAKSIAKWRFL